MPTSSPPSLVEDYAKLQNPWSTSFSHNLPSLTPKSPHHGNKDFSSLCEEASKDFSSSFEEAPSLVDLFRKTGVEEIFAKLEAPPVQSSFSSNNSSNEAAAYIQKGLVISLQSTVDVDRMIAIANGVFIVLRSLDIDFASLYEKVKMFIGCSALKSQFVDSLDKDSSIEELEVQYQEKKLFFYIVSSKLEELCVSLAKSEEHIASLDQKIIQTKDLLKQLEHERSSVQKEHAYFTNSLAQISYYISNSEKDVQAALEAVSQCKKKSVRNDTVKRAFDKAKASLDE